MHGCTQPRYSRYIGYFNAKEHSDTDLINRRNRHFRSMGQHRAMSIPTPLCALSIFGRWSNRTGLSRAAYFKRRAVTDSVRFSLFECIAFKSDSPGAARDSVSSLTQLGRVEYVISVCPFPFVEDSRRVCDSSALAHRGINPACKNAGGVFIGRSRL